MKDRMTDMPVPGLVLRLAIPSIITMMVSNLYNMVDTAFVGRLGTSASGAVGIVFGFMAIIQAFGFTFGQGAAASFPGHLVPGTRKRQLSMHRPVSSVPCCAAFLLL